MYFTNVFTAVMSGFFLKKSRLGQTLDVGNKFVSTIEMFISGHFLFLPRMWSGRVMVLRKLSTPRRPTNLDKGGAMAYCACSRCGWGLFGPFIISCLSFFFLSLSLTLSLRKTVLYRLKYCLNGPLNPKQSTN